MIDAVLQRARQLADGSPSADQLSALAPGTRCARATSVPLAN
jgi:hypothetical protein